jgi:hypothetical protein
MLENGGASACKECGKTYCKADVNFGNEWIKTQHLLTFSPKK